MKVALCQVNTTVGDLAGNEALLARAIREAAAAGADLAVLPELAIPGYPPEDLLLDPAFVGAVAATTARLARVAPHLPVLVGTVASGPPDGAGRTLRNAAALLSGGRVAAVVSKRLLPRDDVFFEPRWFAAGDDHRPLAIGERRVGVLVCEDLWDEAYDRSPARELVAAGADLLVCLNASPYRRGVLAERLRLARRPGVDLVYVNAVGGQDELVFDGASFAVGAGGALRIALPVAEEALAVVDLARPTEVAGWDAGDLERLRRVLVLGLGDFVDKNRLPGVVVGLSGGVDSALVLCLAAEALGPERVRAVHVPSRFTSDRSTADARALGRALGVELAELPLEPLHAAGEALLAAHLPGGARGSTGENLQARLRGALLMAFVNRLGGALLNTSNKTELTLGYGTLYGDMAGALAPIGDLTKPEVLTLARAAYGDAIPASTLDRPPSAELAPDQVDPFDYPAVAPVVEALIQGAPVPDAEAAPWRGRIAAAEFKRRQAPPALKVSARAFGRGRLLPVTHRWSGRGLRRTSRDWT